MNGTLPLADAAGGDELQMGKAKLVLFIVFCVLLATVSVPAGPRCSPRRATACLLAFTEPRRTRDAPFHAPSAPGGSPRPSYCQGASCWGETDQPVRQLVEDGAEPAFQWNGEVEGYAVLAFDGARLSLTDDRSSKGGDIVESSGRTQHALEGSYVVLSECQGPGRVRVIEPMNTPGARVALIEIDDRAIPGKSLYRLTGHLVPSWRVDRFYRPEGPLAQVVIQAERLAQKGKLSSSAGLWAGIAVRARDKRTRLWAIEKFAMLQPYPGPRPTDEEQRLLNILQNQAIQGDSELKDPSPVAGDAGPLTVLCGRNIILAWPREYVASLAASWRFLAELDVCMEWLKEWTGRDEVKRRKRRMISRFRVDEGGTAICVSFRLHIPRRYMTFPPDHGPYSHEMSHGFVSFPALTPTPRFAEGLTEVSRAAYWWFLGLEEASESFCEREVAALEKSISEGRTVLEGHDYATAAGVYLLLARRFCRDASGEIDWHQFATLFPRARRLPVPTDAGEQERWQLMVKVCQQTFGAEARHLLESDVFAATTGSPSPGQSVENGTAAGGDALVTYEFLPSLPHEKAAFPGSRRRYTNRNYPVPPFEGEPKTGTCLSPEFRTASANLTIQVRGTVTVFIHQGYRGKPQQLEAVMEAFAQNGWQILARTGKGYDLGFVAKRVISNDTLTLSPQGGWEELPTVIFRNIHPSRVRRGPAARG